MKRPKWWGKQRPKPSKRELKRNFRSKQHHAPVVLPFEPQPYYCCDSHALHDDWNHVGDDLDQAMRELDEIMKGLTAHFLPSDIAKWDPTDIPGWRGPKDAGGGEIK